ncbi:coiled-coil domain-containing protein 134-like [Diadema antillarum]|uniref:coiled-coil domain-containing protein 134-like n=1 Tax=Diadema antillarum TaxID=105358 RepID=UPI003A864599
MKLPNFLVFVSASLWASTVVQLAGAGKQSAGRKAKDGAVNEDDPELAEYRRLFLEKRRQHVPALQSLFESYEHEKQFKMVAMLLEKMEEMLLQSRIFLNKEQFQTSSTFPTEQTLKDTISLILENVAFVADIALRLPDVTHALLKKNKEWTDILQWAFLFAQDTGYYDDSHQALLNLASQELNFIPRDPNFVNPYSQLSDQMFEMPSKPKKKEKKQKKRGPRVSRSEL